MIVALSIRSFVLIDQLDLEADSGFTALTGETGAGKSIILDALGLVLGDPVNRKQVKAGCDSASVTAAFAFAPDHPVWDRLSALGLDADRGEVLTLRRLISVSGPSRGFVNDQPVSASVLQGLADVLVEIHGQHSASALMRPSSHRGLLDAFAGHETLVADCQTAWAELERARAHRKGLEAAAKQAREQQDWLVHAVEELSKLATANGEATRLAEQRSVLLQSEKMAASVAEADTVLRHGGAGDVLAKAAKAVERVLRIPGLEAFEDGLARAARTAAESIERALIELEEAQSSVTELIYLSGHDSNALEGVEARLFALRAAARKYDVAPDDLTQALERHRAALALCDADTQALDTALAQETAAGKAWQNAANRLSDSRQLAAARLGTAIMSELVPLHLGRVTVRVGLSPIGEGDSGAKGQERVEFEVETNPGAGFGPLRAIASGGELARFSLALKCALSQSGGVQTLIFDEADQGVGGAVAAAIGERLSRLAQTCQVFAITHSPQVASCAIRQWRVRKTEAANGSLITHVAQLDDGQRLEEIARMLSGSSITDEARAAASKLLEAA